MILIGIFQKGFYACLQQSFAGFGLVLPRGVAVWLGELSVSSSSSDFLFLVAGRCLLGDYQRLFWTCTFVVLDLSLTCVFGDFLTSVDIGDEVQSSVYYGSHIAIHHRFQVELGFVEFCFSLFVYLFKFLVFF